MWHEARRREKATQKLFNDHKKRAEKRREENRVDPSSLLQIHGVKSKINLDPNTHKLAAKSLVVWQGDKQTTIDRFDVRATLNSLPNEERTSSSRNRSVAGEEKRHRPTILDADESEPMKKLLSYERYRLLIQNDLNKVPEDKRLKLVNKSESLSEAKMRKLERNYFGTSGEASLSNEYTIVNNRNLNNNLNRNNQQHQQATKFQGVAIGFNYNQPASPSSRSGTYDEVDSKVMSSPPSRTNLASSVPDLDDHANLDLDFVDKCQKGSKRSIEIINRYGLDCDEFNLLIETADDKTTCLSAKEILRRLKQVRAKSKDKLAELYPRPEVSEFYGPTLPPDMRDGDRRQMLEKDECDSADDDTPIPQRSPSGNDILSRQEENDVSQSGCSPSSSKNGASNARISSTSKKNSDLDNIPMPPCDSGAPSQVSKSAIDSVGIQKDDSTRRPPIHIEYKSNNGHVTEHEARIKRDLSPASPQEARRASTPLAYKRYRRSSRSLSRERRISRRHRSSSSSSATDSTYSGSSGSSSSTSSSSSSSSSTASSRSYSSASSRSRTRTRRRRFRTRSRSPRERARSSRGPLQRRNRRRGRRRRRRRR